MVRLHKDIPAKGLFGVLADRQHRPPDMEWMSLRMTWPSTWHHPSLVLEPSQMKPKHHEAETNHPHCAFSEFLNQQKPYKKKKKTVAVLCPKVWDGLSPSNSSWTHTPFTENVLSLLCPWTHLLSPQGIIEMLTFLWVSHPGTLYLHLYFGTYRVAIYLICLAYYTVSSSRTEIVLPCWFKVEAK